MVTITAVALLGHGAGRGGQRLQRPGGDPLDRTGIGTGSNDTPSSGATATTTEANELLVGAVGTEGPDGDASGTWDNSFTAGPRRGTSGDAADTNITASMGWRIVLAADAYTARKSGITSRDRAALIATFKAEPDPNAPLITIAGTPLSAFSTLPGVPSAEQTYTVSGSNLTNDIADLGAGRLPDLVDQRQRLDLVAGVDSIRRLGGADPDLRALQPCRRGDVRRQYYPRQHRGDSPKFPRRPQRNRAVVARVVQHPVGTAGRQVHHGQHHSGSERRVLHQCNRPTRTRTATYSATADEVVEFQNGNLSPNTRYYYRIVYRQTGTTDWNHAAEYTFMTQRAAGSSFTFTVTSDNHLGQYGGQTADELALWEVTLQNIAADQPDFHIDTGDTFPMDPSLLGTGMTDAEGKAAYPFDRPYLSAVTHSTPTFRRSAITK